MVISYIIWLPQRQHSYCFYYLTLCLIFVIEADISTADGVGGIIEVLLHDQYWVYYPESNKMKEVLSLKKHESYSNSSQKKGFWYLNRNARPESRQGIAPAYTVSLEAVQYVAVCVVIKHAANCQLKVVYLHTPACRIYHRDTKHTTT